MDFKSLLTKIGELQQVKEAKEETASGVKHKGKYGTEYQGDADDEDTDDGDKKKKAKKAVAPAEKRGRGRPKKGADSSTGKLATYSGAKDLQDYIVGNKPSKAVEKLPKKKHTLKDWVEQIEGKYIVEAGLAVQPMPTTPQQQMASKPAFMIKDPANPTASAITTSDPAVVNAAKNGTLTMQKPGATPTTPGAQPAQGAGSQVAPVHEEEDGKWIKGAIKHPGAFTKKATAHGMTPAQFRAKVLAHKEDYPAKTEKQAQLAKTLSKLSPGKVKEADIPPTDSLASPLSMEESKMPMKKVNGKSVPSFAADGKGKNDLTKVKEAMDSVSKTDKKKCPPMSHIKKMCKDGMSVAEICKMHPNCDHKELKQMVADCKKKMIKEGQTSMKNIFVILDDNLIDQIANMNGAEVDPDAGTVETWDENTFNQLNAFAQKNPTRLKFAASRNTAGMRPMARQVGGTATGPEYNLKEGLNTRLKAARHAGKSHALGKQGYNCSYDDMEESRHYHEGFKEGLDECYEQMPIQGYVGVAEGESNREMSPQQLNQMWDRLGKGVSRHQADPAVQAALKELEDALNDTLNQGVAEGLDPDTQRLEQEVRDALANGDDYTAKSLVKMAQTAADRNYLRKIIRQEMYGTGPGQGGVAEGQAPMYQVRDIKTNKVVGMHSADTGFKPSSANSGLKPHPTSIPNYHKIDTSVNFRQPRPQLSEIGDTPAGRAALKAVGKRADDKRAAWWANPESGYSSTPKDVSKATDATVAASNRLHGFGPDKSRANTVMARDAMRRQFGEADVEEGNAFTGALARTPHGGQFSVGGKRFKDRTRYDAPVDEMQSMAFEGWNNQLDKLLTEGDVSEGMSVSISKGQQGAPDSVSVTANDADADALLNLVKHAGLGLFGNEGGQGAYGAPTDGTDSQAHGDIAVVNDHDGMMSLMKKLSGVETGSSEGSDDYADEEGNEEEQEEPGHEEEVCGDCGEADCACDDSGDDEEVDEDQTDDQLEYQMAEDTEEDAGVAAAGAQQAGEDAALAGAAGEADAADEEEPEEVEESYANGADDTFEADINFMTKVISDGLNKQKYTGQSTIPVVASQTSRLGNPSQTSRLGNPMQESTNLLHDWKKLSGIK